MSFSYDAILVLGFKVNDYVIETKSVPRCSHGLPELPAINPYSAWQDDTPTWRD